MHLLASTFEGHENNFNLFVMSSFTLPLHVHGRHQMVLEGSKVGASVACMSERASEREAVAM